MIIKPYQCTALGCIHMTAEAHPFCDAHWKQLNGFQKGAINKQADDADYKHQRYSKPYLAAVYRAQTHLGIKDNRIKEELRDRREYYAKTQLDGIKPADIKVDAAPLNERRVSDRRCV